MLCTHSTVLAHARARSCGLPRDIIDLMQSFHRRLIVHICPLFHVAVSTQCLWRGVLAASLGSCAAVSPLCSCASKTAEWMTTPVRVAGASTSRCASGGYSVAHCGLRMMSSPKSALCASHYASACPCVAPWACPSHRGWWW